MTRPAVVSEPVGQMPRYIVIVDADAVLSSVDNDVRQQHRSRLLRMARTGLARVFAAPHVYEDCYRRLPKLASAGPAPLPALIRHFEVEYLPCIRFVDPGERATDDHMAAAVAALDPDDEPTARLARLLAPVVVLSADKDLRRPGLAPEDWRETARALVGVVEAELATAGLATAAVASVSGARAAIRWTAVRLGTSPAVAAVLLGSLLAVHFTHAERRAAVRARIKPIGVAVGRHVVQLNADAAVAREAISAVEIPAAEHPMADQLVASVLARAGGALTCAQIHAAIGSVRTGTESPALPVVSDALRALAGAVEDPRHRWRLGTSLAPRAANDAW